MNAEPHGPERDELPPGAPAPDAPWLKILAVTGCAVLAAGAAAVALLFWLSRS